MDQSPFLQAAVALSLAHQGKTAVAITEQATALSDLASSGMTCEHLLATPADSKAILESWAQQLRSQHHTIDLLYLDSWPRELRDYKVRHLEAYRAMRGMLHDKSVIVLADTASDHAGKGELVISEAEGDGFQVLISDVVTILAHPDLCQAVAPNSLPSARFDTLRFLDGLQFHRQGLTWQAQRIYQATLRQQPAHAEAMHLLGLVFHQRREHALAITWIEKAAVGLPHDPKLWNNLGAAYQALMQFSEAKRCFAHSVHLNPRFVDALSNLGNVELLQHHWSAAEDIFHETLQLEPRHVPTRQRFARLLVSQGRRSEAIAQLTQALEAAPSSGLLKRELADICLQDNRLSDAADRYEEVLATSPQPPAVRMNFAKTLAELDRIEDARTQIDLACAAAPTKHHWRLRQAILCPTVFPNADSIDEYRSSLAQQLNELLNDPPSVSAQELVNLDFYPPFQLSFQGREHRPLKEKFARLFRHWIKPLDVAPRPGAPRIGFVVTRGHEEVFLRCMAAIIAGLASVGLDAVILCAASGEAQLRRGLGDAPILFAPFSEQVAAAVETIAQAGCHVLYYWEIGSDALNYILPFYRLSPVQITSWGTQVTSGLREVDYYLSSSLIEAPDAQQHYTERLHCLSTLLTCQRRVPELPALPRSYFGLPDDRRIYLCPQTVLKLHPEQDELFAKVLEADPEGLLVLKAGRWPVSVQKLKARLERSLGKHAKRVHWVPWQSHHDYLRLLTQGDVLLDTHYFSAGTTTYDIFSACQPLVTLPGQWNIGRYTLACYRKMNMSELVAENADHYAQLAVQVAQDRAWRTMLCEKLKERSPLLFEDRQAITEHCEAFYSMARH